MSQDPELTLVQAALTLSPEQVAQFKEVFDLFVSVTIVTIGLQEHWLTPPPQDKDRTGMYRASLFGR